MKSKFLGWEIVDTGIHLWYFTAFTNLISTKKLLLRNQVVLSLHFLAHWLILMWWRWVGRWCWSTAWRLWYWRCWDKCWKKQQVICILKYKLRKARQTLSYRICSASFHLAMLFIFHVSDRHFILPAGTTMGGGLGAMMWGAVGGMGTTLIRGAGIMGGIGAKTCPGARRTTGVMDGLGITGRADTRVVRTGGGTCSTKRLLGSDTNVQRKIYIIMFF